MERHSSISKILRELGYSPLAVVFHLGLLPLTWEEFETFSGPLEGNGSYYNVMFTHTNL